jgi:hypothetical protein
MERDFGNAKALWFLDFLREGRPVMAASRGYLG